LLVALAIVVALTTPAMATSFVPMSIEDLTRSSVAVVIARVHGVRGVASAGGNIDPYVRPRARLRARRV